MRIAKLPTNVNYPLNINYPLTLFWNKYLILDYVLKAFGKSYLI